MPANCFLRQYHDYAKQQVSSHSSYHLGVALPLVGVCCPRSLLVRGFKKAAFPNVYSVLTGSSGDAEKTLAVDVGLSLLAEGAPHLIGPDPTADETLVKILETRPNQLFCYPDYATFLSKSSGGDQRGEGLRNGFMAYFDGLSFDREYSKGKPIHVVDPRPSILAACTPQHLERYTVGIDWEGGFMSRHMMWWGERERDIPWPKPMPEQRAWLASWLAWSAAIDHVGESLGRTEEAARLWVSWIDSSRAAHAHEMEDEKVRGILARSRLMAVKSALLIAWSSGNQCLEPWTLDAATLEAGIALAELHVTSALGIARNIASTREMAEQKQVYKAVGQDWTPIGDILRLADLTKRQAIPYFETLLEQGVIVTSPQNATTYYKRSSAGTLPWDHGMENLPPAPPIPPYPGDHRPAATAEA